MATAPCFALKGFLSKPAAGTLAARRIRVHFPGVQGRGEPSAPVRVYFGVTAGKASFCERRINVLPSLLLSLPLGTSETLFPRAKPSPAPVGQGWASATTQPRSDVAQRAPLSIFVPHTVPLTTWTGRWETIRPLVLSQSLLRPPSSPATFPWRSMAGQEGDWSKAS